MTPTKEERAVLHWKLQSIQPVLHSQNTVYPRLFCSIYANLLLTAGNRLKLNGAVDQSEEGIIGTDSDILAGTDCGASLSHDDVAGSDCLSVSLLDAKTLGLTVTAVLRRTYALLMSEELQTDS